MSLPALPTYRDMLARTDGPPGTSWGIFGAEDELGTLNLVTAAHAIASAALVRTGEVFSLHSAIDMRSPLDYEDRYWNRHAAAQPRCSPGEGTTK